MIKNKTIMTEIIILLIMFSLAIFFKDSSWLTFIVM